MVKTSNSTSPTAALWLVRMARHSPPPGRCRRGFAVTLAGASSVAVMPSRTRPDAWVEPCRHEVAGQDRKQHGDGDQEEQRLHQREALVVDGVQEHVAETWVVEGILDQ